MCFEVCSASLSQNWTNVLTNYKCFQSVPMWLLSYGTEHCFLLLCNFWENILTHLCCILLRLSISFSSSETFHHYMVQWEGFYCCAKYACVLIMIFQNATAGPALSGISKHLHECMLATLFTNAAISYYTTASLQ